MDSDRRGVPVRVLVTAASKHGATAEIAEAVAKGLADRGVVAEVTALEGVRSLAGYDAVVLGSGVYVGHWLPAAKAFVARLHAELVARPVWVFSSGPLGDPPMPRDVVDVGDLLRWCGAREHRVFAGRLDRHMLGFAQRAIVHAVHAPEGDFRDWGAIDAWAGEIAEALVGGGSDE